jgi:hypothetical protein
VRNVGTVGNERQGPKARRPPLLAKPKKPGSTQGCSNVLVRVLNGVARLAEEVEPFVGRRRSCFARHPGVKPGASIAPVPMGRAPDDSQHARHPPMRRNSSNSLNSRAFWGPPARGELGPADPKRMHAMTQSHTSSNVAPVLPPWMTIESPWRSSMRPRLRGQRSGPVGRTGYCIFSARARSESARGPRGPENRIGAAAPGQGAAAPKTPSAG